MQELATRSLRGSIHVCKASPQRHIASRGEGGREREEEKKKEREIERKGEK